MESLGRENVSIAHKLPYLNFKLCSITKGDAVWAV